MSDINTNFNNAPYFDDYLENKKFYRILFKPGTSVQARELSQLQTILQKQISRFGSHVFKNGSIVDGVNPTIIDQAHVVRVRNSYTNNNVVDLEEILNSSNNLFLVSLSSDVEAKILNQREGSESESPNTKRLYVTYTNVDDTNTKTAVGNISIIENSNTVTGTGTSFNSYAVGDYFTIFETPNKRRVSFQAKIDNIANNTSLTLNRRLSFANSNVTSNNFTIHRNLSEFGILGTEDSPEILNVIDRTVRNSQANTVDTSVSANTFLLDFSVANTDTLNVFVNGEEQTPNRDYTPNTTHVVMSYNLRNNEVISFVEELNTVKYSGLQCFKSPSVQTSQRATVASNQEGVVYHKGQFLNIDPGFIVVSDTLEGANSSLVAINSNESIVTFKSDTSLLDNAAGFSNEVAPGADRLKIDPFMVAANTANVDNQEAVAILINFNDEGEVLTENRDPQYNILGDELAKINVDHAGSFTVKRFTVDTQAGTPNNELVDIIVEPGLGYVNGHKVETLSPIKETINRGTNTLQREDFELGINYGNYVRVKEFNGNFAPYDRVTFVHNGANQGYFPASNTTFLTALSSFTPGSSNNVGRAYVKSVELESGTAGAPDAVYRIHLFGVEQSANDSIQNARTIVTNDTVKGGADIILDSSNNAVITRINDLPIDGFGESGIRTYTDSTSTFDNNFVIRKFSSVTDTLNANGNLIIDVDDEIDLSGNNSIGSYNTSEVNNLVISNVGSEITCNSTGVTTSSGNVITLSAGFSANIHVGDIVQIDTGNKVIVTKINSATEIQTNIASTDTTGTLKKVIPVGKTIPVDSAMVTTSQLDNTLILNIPVLNNSTWSGSTTVRSTYEFNGRDYKPFSKNIKKNLFRKINTSTNTANSIGPWDLGVVDIHKVTGVWILSNSNDGSANGIFNDSDLTDSSNKINGGFFEIDSGQRDHFYDYASLHLTNKGRYRNLVSANSTIVVRFDAFTVDNNDGEGYFTVDSYPVTSSRTANTTNIKFEEIPNYITSSKEKIALRDVVDYRPRLNNKESTNLLSGVANTASVNVTNVKDKDSAKSSGNSKNSFLIFKDDSEFVSDYKINVGKRADVYIGETGTLTVSVSNNNISPAPEVPKAMRVGSVNIPPFPSLTREEATAAENVYSGNKLRDKRTEFNVIDYKIRVDQFNIRRYTMKDIGTLDERITNLEYYASLNALESDTFNKQFKNANGIERFKNGIFVEPFNSHQFGATDDNEYKVAIDKNLKHFRPKFEEVLVDNFTPEIVSGNVDVFGHRIMYNYTDEEYLKQSKATKVRPAAPVSIRFIGNLDLFPEYDAGTEVNNVGQIIVNPDEEPPVQDGATSTIWGRWRTTNVSSEIINGRRGRMRFVTSTAERQGTQTTFNVTESIQSIGERVTDVTAIPFIRELAIRFRASGLRPREQHSVFFNNVNVDEHVQPARFSIEPIISLPDWVAPQVPIRNLDDGVIDEKIALEFISSSSDVASAHFSPEGPKGTPLITSRNGSCAGIFFVPKETFLQGDRNFVVADIQNLETEEDAILSSASKMFYSNLIGVEKEELVERQFDVTTTTRNVVNRRTTTQGIDPIAQTFYVRGDNLGNEDGIFISSLSLYFRRKSSKNGINVYICETDGGYPNTSKIYGASKVNLPPARVNVSSDASVATNFKFSYPVFLRKDRSYAFVIRPDADDPDYDVYFSQLGGADITTGSAVNSQPYEGVAFLGANQDTWSALQDEDIKFTLNRAVFETGPAEVRMVPRNFDRGEYEDITFFNNKSFIQMGDLVYGMTNANNDPNLTVGNVNTSIFGFVSGIDDINNVVTIAPSSGNFTTSANKNFDTTRLDGSIETTTKYKIAFYRPRDLLEETDNLNIDRFVGTSFMSLRDHEFSTVVPQFTSRTYKKSSIDFDFTYNISNTSSKSFAVPNEEEYEHTDNPLVLRSRTNERLKLGSATGNSSFFITVNMFNGTDKTSPMIDTRRTLLNTVGNLTISPDIGANNFIDGTSVSDENTASIYSEMFSGLGESNVRYISQPVTLADGQDAEDMRVLVSAFKPPRGKVYVFGRFVNQYDNLDDVLFTPLKDITPEVNSSRNDRNDIREFEFRMFNRDEINDTEWVKIFNNSTGADYAFKYTNKYTANSLIATDPITGVADYFRNGTTYKTFKIFQLKVVTYATIESVPGFGVKNSSNPAIIESVRAVALQV